MVGRSDPKGLFQPKQLYNSMKCLNSQVGCLRGKQGREEGGKTGFYATF